MLAEPAEVERSSRRLVLTIVVLFTIFAGFFVSPVVLRRVGINGDLGWHFLPMRGLYASHLQRGQAFDWMPEMFGGYLLTGEGQHGPYHPLHLLAYRFLPLDTAFALEICLPTFLLAGGLVFFLRRYVAMPAACLGGFLGAYSLNFLVHMQQPCITWIVAHLPWMLAAIDEATGTDSPRRCRWAFASIALLTGSQLLLGHPQTTWFTMLVAALFALYRLILKRSPPRVWGLVAGGVLLGVGLGAVQLLATYELLATTHRGVTDASELAYPAVDARTFIGVLEPGSVWGAVFPTYFGVVPTMLALWLPWALWFRGSSRGSWGRSDVAALGLWALGIVLLTAVLSLGREGLMYRLQMMLPLVGSFRGPARYLMMSQVCAAVVAAVAYAKLIHLSNEERRPPRVLAVVPWVFAGLTVVLVVRTYVRGSFNPEDHRLQSQPYLGALLYVATALAMWLALRGNGRARRFGLLAIAVVAGADVGLFSVFNSHLGGIYWRRLPTYEEYLASHPVPPESPEEASGRLLHAGNKGDYLKRINPYLLMGYRATNGNAGLYVRRSLDYRQLNTLRVAQTAWYWQPPNDEKLHVKGLTPPPGGGWCEVPNPLPRARLVTRAVPSDAPADDIVRIDVDREALVTRPIDLPAGRPGRAEVVEDEPGRLAIDVSAPSRQLLVLTESHHRSWRVTVDGEPVELERVNGDFIGCVVEAGDHRVAFDFRCTALSLGKGISLFSLSLVFVVLVWPISSHVASGHESPANDGDETDEPMPAGAILSLEEHGIGRVPASLPWSEQRRSA